MSAASGYAERQVLTLALAFHAGPLRYQGYVQGSDRLPQPMTVLLAVADENSAIAQDWAGQLAVDRSRLAAAARFFIEQVCFQPDAPPRRILGVPEDASLDMVREHYRLLIRLFHPDRHDLSDHWSDRFAERVTSAYNELRRRLAVAGSGSVEGAADVVHDAWGQQLAPGFEPSVPRPTLTDPSLGAPPSFALRPRAAQRSIVIVLVLLVVGAVVFAVVRQPDELETTVRMTPPQRPLPGSSAASQTATVAPALPESAPAPATAPDAIVDDEVRPVAEPVIAATRSVEDPDEGAQTVIRQPAGSPPRRPIIARPQPQPAPVVIAEAPAPRPTPVLAPPAPAVAPASPQPAPAPSSAQVAEAPPAPQAPPRELTESELELLAARFQHAYEHGDLNRFLALFSDDVRSNGGQGREVLRRDYRLLFGTTEMRRVEVLHINWRLLAGEAVGSGRIRILVRHRGESQNRVVSGTLQLSAALVDDAPRISRFVYDNAGGGGG